MTVLRGAGGSVEVEVEGCNRGVFSVVAAIAHYVMVDEIISS